MSDFEDDEEAQVHRGIFDEDDLDDDETHTSGLRDDFSVGQLNWDEDVPQNVSRTLVTSPVDSILFSGTTEQTPLLAKEPSRVLFSHLPRPTHHAIQDSQGHSLGNDQSAQSLSRRMSSNSIRSVTGSNYDFGGQSTYGQTVCLSIALLLPILSRCFKLFNSIAILLGIGMLSEPLAFVYAGWIMGTILIVSYGFVACHT